MPEKIVDIFGPVPYELHLRHKGGLSRDGHIFLTPDVAEGLAVRRCYWHVLGACVWREVVGS